MNERIKELAEQSGVHFGIGTTDYFGEHFPPWISTRDMDLEKFAELIVRECIKESMEEIIDDGAIASEYDPSIREYLKGNNAGIVDAVVRFRNHFGVTE